MTMTDQNNHSGRVDAAATAHRLMDLGSMANVKSSSAFDDLMQQIDRGEITLDGKDGLVQQLIKASLERGLRAELTDHLGYVEGDPKGRNGGNSRNGTYPKTVATTVGDVALAIPRDRDGSFTPRLVPQGSRRIGGLDDMIVSLYAGGMTIRDIQHHLEATIGTVLSHETISAITNEVLDEVTAWQTRPLDAVYPILYLDALVIKIRDGHHVINKAAHLAIGVDLDGIKNVLGIWVQAHEGAKFWMGVCAELANRGVRDVLIACCDGLTGFPEAIQATWPFTTVQTCVVHLIRSSMRFVSYTDRKKLAAELRLIYTAPNAEAASMALEAFATGELGVKYPAAVNTWRNAWDRFTPFLAFPPDLRRVIYTTNAIESLNYQLRKVTKNRGHFPNDQAAVKLLWLAVCNIEDKRARERAKTRTSSNRGGHSTLVEGSSTRGWNQPLQHLTLTYPERIANYIN
ncbi:IS256 family transposase [Micrococcales bacterium 31B]|nr:IS256 family transposase [Micrococcales bacterium 31B]